MNKNDKLFMLDEIIKYSQKAKLEIHNNIPNYIKNVVMGFNTSKMLFESLKDDNNE